jgi:putative aldouronate transport system permease protein
MERTVKRGRSAPAGVRRIGLFAALWKYKYFYLMLIPGLVYIIVFHYLPMAGLAMAFQDFKLVKGIFGSAFNGLDNFRYLFKSDMFTRAFGNTAIISAYKILFGFPIPILLALFLNEIRVSAFKRTVQTIFYLPHFLSWIVMFALVYNFVKELGPLNYLIRALGGKTVFFLSDERYFRGLIVVSDIWKEMGWNAIIYLAALAGVPQDLYESATIDGASRMKCLWRISLPSIMPTIVIMFLLRIGSILNAGFEQIFSLYNSAVFSVGDIIDTYVYRIGFKDARFGVASAAGMFKSVIACILVITTNRLMGRFDQETLF